MSSKHGGYSEDEIRQATGSSDEAMFAAGEESFADYAATLPEDANDLLREPAPTEQDIEEQQRIAQEKERKTARIALSKKMKKKMEAFRNQLSTTLPSLFFDRMAEKHEQPGWRLSKDEKEAIKDSVETFMELADVEFAFNPIEIQLTSIWWVVLYPIATIGIVFGLKSMEYSPKKKDEQQF